MDQIIICSLLRKEYLRENQIFWRNQTCAYYQVHKNYSEYFHLPICTLLTTYEGAYKRSLQPRLSDACQKVINDSIGFWENWKSLPTIAEKKSYLSCLSISNFFSLSRSSLNAVFFPLTTSDNLLDITFILFSVSPSIRSFASYTFKEYELQIKNKDNISCEQDKKLLSDEKSACCIYPDKLCGLNHQKHPKECDFIHQIYYTSKTA